MGKQGAESKLGRTFCMTGACDAAASKMVLFIESGGGMTKLPLLLLSEHGDEISEVSGSG